MTQAKAIFFDIGDTLATAQFTPAGKLASLHPLPGVLQALASLRQAGLRLGIISNTGTETPQTMRQVLTGAGLYPLLTKSLLIYSSVVGMEKDSPEIFRLAVARAGLHAMPAQCMFVGENAAERAFAAQADMQTAESVAAAAASLGA